MSKLLVLENLLVKRGGRTVLDLKSLEIEKGEVLAVVGPNGAGKSTLLLTLARLLKPGRGEIWFNGRPAAGESALTYRRRIGLVMQDPLLFDSSVYGNIATGLRFRGCRKVEIDRRVSVWLERLHIHHLSGRRATELSGGEAQRVSLARALVLEPELLLLDEPFAALDPPTRQRLVNDLAGLLREQRITTVFVTHDLGEAARLADRVAILLDSQLRQFGLPEMVFKAPADAEVAAFLDCMAV